MHSVKKFSVQEESIIDFEVQNLPKLDVIGLSSQELGECVSPIFVIQKQDGYYRLIFNFKNCNQVVLFRHFKMDTFNTILNLVNPGVYMASLDLKHAYYTLPIAREQP